MSENQELTVKSDPKTGLMAYGPKGVQIASLEDGYRFAKYVVASGFAPKGLEKPESVLIAIQLGAEIGLTPMASLQNIGVINGRPGIYGDAALALVRGSGLCKTYSQKIAGEGEQRKAVVKSVRNDGTEIETEFSVADAKKAGLWGKQGPWTQYPDRMLVFRARGFNLRDNFGDVLKGLRTTEELADTPRDITSEVEVGPAVSEPPKASIRNRVKTAPEPEAAPVEPTEVESPAFDRDAALVAIDKSSGAKCEKAYKACGLNYEDYPIPHSDASDELLAKLVAALK